MIISYFLNRLDQPPAPNAALRKTMQTPAPWGAKKMIQAPRATHGKASIHLFFARE